MVRLGGLSLQETPVQSQITVETAYTGRIVTARPTSRVMAYTIPRLQKAVAVGDSVGFWVLIVLFEL